MPDQERTQKKIGLSVGNTVLGLDLKNNINAMKPGDLRYVKSWGRLFIIRYRKDGELLVLDVRDGSIIFRG